MTNRKSPDRRGKVQLVDAREFWVKMRKSLGEKRKAISPEQIEEITRLYGAFEENERVKIFGNEHFGYQRITVERPLRIRYTGGEEARSRLEASKAFAKLGEAEQKGLRELVAALGELSTTDRAAAIAAATALNGKLSRPEEKALLEALAVRDPEAPPVAEPDAELRDQENAPLPDERVAFEPDPSARIASESYRRAVGDHMQAEVLPYVPDAWVDHAKTRIGYEMPLTRHFYKYVAPKALDELDRELRELEATIADLLAKAQVARAALTSGLDPSRALSLHGSELAS